MRAGRRAGHSHRGNGLSGFDHIINLGNRAVAVKVQSVKVPSLLVVGMELHWLRELVMKSDDESTGTEGLNAHHGASVRGHNRIADSAADVQAAVEIVPSADLESWPKGRPDEFASVRFRHQPPACGQRRTKRGREQG